METFNPRKRLAVPIWRNEFKSALNGEFDSPFSHVKQSQPHEAERLKDMIIAWKTNKSLPFAADLVNAAYVLGEHDKVSDAVEFIINNVNDEASSLYRFSKRLLAEINGTQVSPELIRFDDHSKYGAGIRYYKDILKENPKNPIGWVELARLFSAAGIFDKAEPALANALQLSPDNRYILRSAASFYFHKHDNQDFEKAHSLIRKSQYVKFDPWLLSAEISLSSKLGRSSALFKTATNLVESPKYTAFAISELASSIATFLLNRGEIKKSKNYFKLSLKSPHENAVNQAISFADQGYNKERYEQYIQNLAFPYEAKAQHLSLIGEYEGALIESYRWLDDQPFSLRPIYFGSYISSVYLEDHESAIKLLKFGHKNRPSNIIISNNIAYNNLMLGKIEEAEKILKKLTPHDMQSSTEKSKVCLGATIGLYEFKTNNFELGRKFYLKAIEDAKKLKEDSIAALASANYAREEILANTPNVQNAMEILYANCKGKEEPDIKILFERAVKLFKARIKV